MKPRGLRHTNVGVTFRHAGDLPATSDHKTFPHHAEGGCPALQRITPDDAETRWSEATESSQGFIQVGTLFLLFSRLRLMFVYFYQYII